jgi:hypothetical protein
MPLDAPVQAAIGHGMVLLKYINDYVRHHNIDVAYHHCCQGSPGLKIKREQVAANLARLLWRGDARG